MFESNFDELVKEYHELCLWHSQHPYPVGSKTATVTKPALHARLKLDNRVVETQEVL